MFAEILREVLNGVMWQRHPSSQLLPWETEEKITPRWLTELLRGHAEWNSWRGGKRELEEGSESREVNCENGLVRTLMKRRAMAACMQQIWKLSYIMSLGQSGDSRDKRDVRISQTRIRTLLEQAQLLHYFNHRGLTELPTHGTKRSHWFHVWMQCKILFWA